MTTNLCTQVREVQDPDAVLATEREMAAWIAAHHGVPGIEVHADSDATWMVQPGAAWANCVVNVRFEERAAGRLDRILRRYRATKRGVGFWISPFATPADLTRHLDARGLRCRKHFPAMFCDLKALPQTVKPLGDITISVLDDHAIFEKHAHPYFGDIRTKLRRFELTRLDYLNQQRPRRVWDFVAWRDGKPASVCTMFMHGSLVGFHDVGTLPAFRRQGIATSLMRHACHFAREHGCETAVLLASGEGYEMYQRAGFHHAGSISYWYRAFRAA